MCKQKHCVCVCTCGDSAAWRTVCSGQQAVKFNLSVLISQPGILGWQNPIASLKHWDPPSPPLFYFYSGYHGYYKENLNTIKAMPPPVCTMILAWLGQIQHMYFLFLARFLFSSPVNKWKNHKWQENTAVWSKMSNILRLESNSPDDSPRCSTSLIVLHFYKNYPEKWAIYVKTGHKNTDRI